MWSLDYTPKAKCRRRATYGGPDSAATVKLSCLAGTGVMTVAEYGGPKGLMLILR